MRSEEDYDDEEMEHFIAVWVMWLGKGFVFFYILCNAKNMVESAC